MASQQDLIDTLAKALLDAIVEANTPPGQPQVNVGPQAEAITKATAEAIDDYVTNRIILEGLD